MSADDVRYRDLIPIIAQEDTDRVLAKDRDYGASWKKRGGIGAYMMVARKFDRLETMCAKHGYDVFKACAAEGGTESLLDTIRDARSYLDLIEAEVRVQQNTKQPPVMITTYPRKSDSNAP